MRPLVVTEATNTGQDARVGEEWSLAFGWLSLGLLNVVAVDILRTPASGLWGVRFSQHAVDLGRHVAFAVLAASLSYLSARFLVTTRSGQRLAWALYWAASMLVGRWLLPEDVAGMASRNAELLSIPTHVASWLLIAAISSTAPLSVLAFKFLSRPFTNRLIAAVYGISLYVVNNNFSPLDNAGIHFFVSVANAHLLAAAMSGLASVVAQQADGVRAGARVGAWCIFLGWGAWAIGYPHGSAVLVEASHWPGALLVEELAWSRGTARASSAPLLNPYFRNRGEQEPIAPSHALDLASDAIVLLLSIDGMRADVLSDEKQRTYVPTISALAQQGAMFTEARTPGSQTVVSLSSLSTSSYFSQQEWTRGTVSEELWPFEDSRLHLAELLTKAHLRTVCIPTTLWLQNKYGIVQGFAENVYPANRTKWLKGSAVTDGVIGALESHRIGPMFLFVHYLDTHSPYKAGGSGGSVHDHYLRSLRYVDSEIARILGTAARLGLSQRLTLIVTSDHGEAFGEHGTRFHSTTVYDELLRVPLIIHGPQITPRRIATPVSLVDVAPTVLDLYQLPTPGEYMGQSLAPLLAGQSFQFERPIAADSRLKRAIVFPGGWKVIHNDRMDATEVYDLKRDPGELHNLYPIPKLEDEVVLLHAFFEQHQLRKDGYEPPYRK